MKAILVTVFSKMKWKIFVYVACTLLPFVLLPLALSEYKEYQCTFVLIILAAYWLLEPVPMPAVSLLPLVLFPLLGIISSSEVSKNYMKEGYVTFIGGMMAAIAVENCKLHERIALKVLLLVGTEIKWIMLGIMLTTMSLSMWMTNAATAAVMVPIVDALVGGIRSNTKETHPEESNFLTDNIEIYNFEEKDKLKIKYRKEKFDALKVTLLLGVCYAANIGGTGTIIGTTPNLALLALLQKLYPGSDEITFATWMMYNIPGVLLCILFGWLYLWLVNIYFSKINPNDVSKDEIYEIISKRYNRLGSMTPHEASVMILFSLLIALWIFRDPKFIPGWATVLGVESKVGDSTVAMAIASLMCFLPSDFRDLSSQRILEWKTIQTKFPWGVIFLLGAGSSLAQGAQVSGLSDLIGSKLSALSVLPPGAIVAIICFTTTTFTEIASNTATAMILLPIVSEMALAIGLNPLYLLLPCSIACSYAFMLPVATISNALVFENGSMKIMDMLKPGIVMNVVCCCIQLFFLHTLGVGLFDLNNFPIWANQKEKMAINATGFENTPTNAIRILNSTVVF